MDLGGVPERKRSRAASQLQGNLLAIAMTASNTGGWWTSDRSWTFEQLGSAAQPTWRAPARSCSATTRQRWSREARPGRRLSTEQRGWSLDWKIDGKQLVPSRHDGTVPDEQRGQLGAHRLVMPDDRWYSQCRRRRARHRAPGCVPRCLVDPGTVHGGCSFLACSYTWTLQGGTAGGAPTS